MSDAELTPLEIAANILKPFAIANSRDRQALELTIADAILAPSPSPAGRGRAADGGASGE